MGRGVSASGCNHCLEDGLTNDEMHRVQIVQWEKLPFLKEGEAQDIAHKCGIERIRERINE